MQPAASPVREHIDALYHELLVIITLIALLVMALAVADYIAEALGHPRYGYCVTRDQLDARGDFVTAPEDQSQREEPPRLEIAIGGGVAHTHAQASVAAVTDDSHQEDERV